MAYGRGRASSRGGPRGAAGGARRPARRPPRAPAAAPRGRRRGGARGPGFDAARVEALIHEFVNAARRERGLPRLARARRMDWAARHHSLDTAARGYFSHVSPEGEDPTGRGERYGYRCSKRDGPDRLYGLAENIFRAHTYRSYAARGDLSTYRWLSGEAELASRLVLGWMRRPVHRENMLDDSHCRTGVGVAISRDESVLATQNFC